MYALFEYDDVTHPVYVSIKKRIELYFVRKKALDCLNMYMCVDGMIEIAKDSNLQNTRDPNRAL